MKQKSMKNIRQEFRDKGIFYTPPELAVKLASYVGRAERKAPYTVYDPTCGTGSLLTVFPDEARKYGQELDAEQMSLIDCPNFRGYAGDTLADDGFRDMKFDVIVANPPFSVRWDPEALKDDPRFTAAPCLPPPSKADWAFVLHCLYHLKADGVAAILEFPGILYRGQREYKIRRWFVENNYIDRIVNIPGNTFEDTSINTCIIVLRKNREGTDIVFENGERERKVPLQEITDNDFALSVNTYLPDDVRKEETDIDSINRQVVTDTISHVRDTFETLTGLQETFPDDNFYLPELRSGLREVLETYPGNRAGGKTEMSEWIGVKDRLPERPEPKNPGCFVASENYLVYEPDVGVYVAFYMFGSSRRNFYYRDTDHPRKGVTHWMPLPEPPKESGV